MTSTGPTLTQEIARLRQSAEADQAHGYLPAALHALIMAALARLFARLEQVFQLWQSGQLPPPRATTPPSATPALHGPRREMHQAPRQARTVPRARRIPRATTNQAPRRATFRAPAPHAMPASPRGILTPKPPAHSRAPPRPPAPIPRHNRPARIADPRPSSFHHQFNPP